ncbi:hypothetical protein H8356DRAFT_1426937 [Neocallimastix lanati (nom. inval.)]|nr:hypothetical protein H8356DRAFT_1426937 [Neocallimastix sp. JGI-2020a]
MEGNLKIDISETNRGKEQIIIDRKFKYNFSKLKKDNTKIYRCTEYKTLNKCKSFIILIDNKEVLNYDSSHNHPGNEINAFKSLIKHKIKDEIKKSLIPDIKSKLPNESEYYKTIRGEYFMIFKNSNIIIFQSPFQAKLFMENKHIFADGTFLIAPTNKQTTYEILFNEIKKNIIKYNANINFSEKIFHCDFEKGISNAEVKDHNILNTYYKEISNLSFINIEYIPDIFNKIKNTYKRYESTCSQFLNFLDYFEKTFLNIYNIKYWNYYNNIDHITNNASESYNSYLKNLFVKKPSFYKLIYAIQFEESKSYYDYRELKEFGEKRAEYQKGKNDIIENWFNCLVRLNNKIINFNNSK